MDRRSFLRRASLIAAGVVAADQIELLEMLAPRRLFPSIALDAGDYNRQFRGLLDMLQSTSLHGLSTSTYPVRWAA